MTLEWIGAVILLVVVLPVVVYLLHGVLQAANGIVPSVARISTPSPCCSPPRTKWSRRSSRPPPTAGRWT
jgi:hypothetical protein